MDPLNLSHGIFGEVVHTPDMDSTCAQRPTTPRAHSRRPEHARELRKGCRVTVTVRPAEPRDSNAAALVLQRSIREVCGPDYGNDNALLEDWCANKTPEQVIEWIADPSLETLVAERDGEVVGVGQLNGSAQLT